MAARSRITQSLGGWRLPVSAVWLLMVLILLLPLSALVTTSLTQGFGQSLNLQSLTCENYRNALFDYPAIHQAFFTSLGLTLLAVIILTVMALFMACFLSWQRSRLVSVLHLSTELAYALPGMVTGIAAHSVLPETFAADECQPVRHGVDYPCGLSVQLLGAGAAADVGRFCPHRAFAG